MTHVSCMMVTKPGRETLARRAIDDFCRQTHPHRDLVVVTTAEESYTELWTHADRVAAPGDVHVWATAEVDPAHGRDLGHLRNLALEHAAGPVVAQWDDDDRHHPQRLEDQLRSMTISCRHSCFLTSQLYYFMDDRPPFLHVVDWTLRPVIGSGILIPGTLVCHKSAIRYQDQLRLGDDTKFLQDEIKAHGRSAQVDRPGLYARGFHGLKNTTARAAALRNARERGWDRRRIEARLDELRADVAALGLPEVQLRAAGENVHVILGGAGT